jgi:hypothetical protein
VVGFTLWPLYPQGKSPWYPLDLRLGGPQSQYGHGGEEKNSQPLLGIKPPIIQPITYFFIKNTVNLFFHITTFLFGFPTHYMYNLNKNSSSLVTLVGTPKILDMLCKKNLCDILTVAQNILVQFLHKYLS